jgi:hypothetical protein
MGLSRLILKSKRHDHWVEALSQAPLTNTPEVHEDLVVVDEVGGAGLVATQPPDRPDLSWLILLTLMT